MVQLRVDVEAANARREFNSASRTARGFADALAQAEHEANQLGDQLTVAERRVEQTTREFQAAERAADDAADNVRQLRQQVDALGGAAPQALVEQLRRAEDALRDAEREEQRLRDGMEDATHEANRFARAATDAGDRVQHITRQLAEARREADRLRLAMNAANRQANNPLRGAQRGLLGFRQQIDQLLSQSPMGGLRNAVEQAWQALPVEIKGVVVIAGAALAATFATAVGAAVVGLLEAALGAAVIGVFAAIAAKTDAVVQNAFKDTFKPIGDELKRISLITEGPLVGAAKIFGQAWDDASDSIRRMVQDVAPEIEDLAGGLAGFVREALPGIEQAVHASVPLLKELSADLPKLGAAISYMFEAFSRGGDGAQKGLRLVIVTVAALIETVADAFEFLSNKFNDFTNDMQMLSEGLASIPVIGKLFEPAAEFWRSFNDLGEGSIRTLDGVSGAADNTGLSMQREAAATQRAAAAAAELSKKIDDLISTQLDAQRAAISFEAAIDAVTESAKANGKSLDITTEKGRNNANALLDAVDAAERKRQADIDMAGGQNASAAAVAKANATYQAQVQQIIAVARAAGFNQAQIDALIGSYARIPQNVTTNVRTIYTREYRTVGDVPRDQRVGSGSIKGYASGVRSAPPGWAWVGEKGPELMRFRGGEDILTASESARAAGARSAAIAAKAGASTPPVYNYTVNVTSPVGSSPADVGKAVVEAIKSYEKSSGSGWRRA